MNDYQNYIKNVLAWAKYKGLVKTIKQFADAVGCNDKSLCSVINGYHGNSGRNTYFRVKKWAEESGYDGDTVFEMPTVDKVDPKPNYEFTEKTLEILDNWDWEKFRREAAMRMLTVTCGWKLTRDDGASRMLPKAAAVKIAIEWADELVKQLRDGHEESTGGTAGV